MKVKEILVLQEAIDDLENGKDFYELQEPGIGEYFWNSLVSDIESLYLYAGIHPKTAGYYRILSKRFPYAVYYSYLDNIVKIMAVLPMKRDPLWIKKRLSGDSK